jgi:hypothetical protein
MPELEGKAVTAEEVAGFYRLLPGFWFLLEVLETNEAGKARLLRVIRYNKRKDELREHLLEEPISPDSKYIFVHADPDGKCDID